MPLSVEQEQHLFECCIMGVNLHRSLPKHSSLDDKPHPNPAEQPKSTPRRASAVHETSMRSIAVMDRISPLLGNVPSRGQNGTKNAVRRRFHEPAPRTELLQALRRQDPVN